MEGFGIQRYIPLVLDAIVSRFDTDMKNRKG
jgi:hypothetical protein